MGANRLFGPLNHGQAAGSVTHGVNTDAGTALALGAFLDGIPEQPVLGIGIAAGDGVSVGLLVAIFVSNLPEAIGSATEMRARQAARHDPPAVDRRSPRSARPRPSGLR